MTSENQMDWLDQSHIGKMSPASSTQRTTLLGISLEHWRATGARFDRQKAKTTDGDTVVLSLDPAGQSFGAPSIPNFSAWPNTAVVVFLWRVLHPPIRGMLRRFYLSGKACAGIVGRADRKGKSIPLFMRISLIQGVLEARLRDNPTLIDKPEYLLDTVNTWKGLPPMGKQKEPEAGGLLNLMDGNSPSPTSPKPSGR